MHALILAENIPVNGLANYGLSGAVLLVLITFGWLEINAERTRANNCQKALEDLNQLIREKYMDGLANAYRATVEAHDLITILRDELRQRPR